MDSNNKSLTLYMLATLFFMVTSLLSFIQADVHYYDFVLREKNYTRLCGTKSMLVVNDSFPGPTIRVHKGDTIYVNVYNQGYYGVTIHWHGVKQPRNPWSDGPEYITQCPIRPGSNFIYQVIFTDEEGTLWWHAHSDWTRNSVHGAIVVSPTSTNSYPFPKPDDEHIIILGSWYVGDLRELVNEALLTDTDLPHSTAYTINGQPGDLLPCSSEGTHRWEVEHGKTYLLRIINAVMSSELFFAIAEHNLTIVGMDGAYLKPFETSYIVISTGQAMDVLVTTNQYNSDDENNGVYYIAARAFSSESPDSVGFQFDEETATAILQYKGIKSKYSSLYSPLFPNNTLPSYFDIVSALKFVNKLRSLDTIEHPVNVPINITTRMYITLSFNEFNCRIHSCDIGGRAATTMNNLSWVNPEIDILQAYYRKIDGVYTTNFPDEPPYYYDFTADSFPEGLALTIQGTRVKVLEYNEGVEIVFQGTNLIDSAQNHPMHLHGHSFYVVGYGVGNYNNLTDPLTFNFFDPPRVNTFSVPRNGWLAIRFFANNPGVWFWHCHIERHMSLGMDTVFIVKNGSTVDTSIRQPPAYMPPCKDPSDIQMQNASNFYDNQLENL